MPETLLKEVRYQKVFVDFGDSNYVTGKASTGTLKNKGFVKLERQRERLKEYEKIRQQSQKVK